MAASVLVNNETILSAQGKTEFETLGDRVKFCLKFRGMTQKELAKAVNLTQQNIQAICSGKIKSSRHNNEIAHALGVSPVWLSSGQEHRDSHHATILKETSQIPIWELEENKLSKETCKFVDVITNENEVCFAIYMYDNSLSPRVNQGNLLLFRQNDGYQDNDIVLARLENFDNKYLCRIISQIENGKLLLKAEDPCFGEILSTTCPFTIIGVLKEIRILA